MRREYKIGIQESVSNLFKYQYIIPRNQLDIWARQHFLYVNHIIQQKEYPPHFKYANRNTTNKRCRRFQFNFLQESENVFIFYCFLHQDLVFSSWNNRPSIIRNDEDIFIFSYIKICTMSCLNLCLSNIIGVLLFIQR